MNATDGVDLLQDCHETGKDSGEEEASKGDGGVSIVPEGQKMQSSIGTGNDDTIIIEVYFAFADNFGRFYGDAALLIAHISLVNVEGLFNRCPAMLVDVLVVRDGMNLAIDANARPNELFVSGNKRHVGVEVDGRNLRAQNDEAFAARCKHFNIPRAANPASGPSGTSIANLCPQMARGGRETG